MIPPVVDREWLSARSGEVVLADVRWYLDGRSGRAAYLDGHLRGAVFVDLDRWLAAPASESEGRHPLPSPAVFAEGMAELGISDEATVVAYDDAGGVIAARLVWLLRAIGHDAALLDGGLDAGDRPLETGAAERLRAVFTAREWPAARLATMDDAADPALAVIDARPHDRFAGGPDDVDPRAGHIPGARSLPCRENLASDRTFLPRSELRNRFAAVGIAAGAASGADVVSYCGSGVTACHNLLAMEHSGLGLGRLYPGSWSQWSRDPSRPAIVDPA